MQEQRSAEQVGGVVASLDRVDGERRFVVRNLGELTAHDVSLRVAAERDKNTPVSTGDLRRIFPIKALDPGESASVCAIITPGTGLHFRAVVEWKDADGSAQERVFYLSV